MPKTLEIPAIVQLIGFPFHQLNILWMLNYFSFSIAIHIFIYHSSLKLICSTQPPRSLGWIGLIFMTNSPKSSCDFLGPNVSVCTVQKNMINCKVSQLFILWNHNEQRRAKIIVANKAQLNKFLGKGLFLWQIAQNHHGPFYDPMSQCALCKKKIW